MANARDKEEAERDQDRQRSGGAAHAEQPGSDRKMDHGATLADELEQVDADTMPQHTEDPQSDFAERDALTQQN
ncbi:MAG: hypothetical protein ABIO43_04160, partial [Sphingomicrobium sp.]